MGADLSRIRSNPLLDFSGVELKQGGVVLDADFNELVAVTDRRFRAAASDILGRSTVSSSTPDAFKITLSAAELQIGIGRLYVDGLLAECHGREPDDRATWLFDPLMGESVFKDPVPYGKQPYFPNPPGLPSTGRHLVYLDVWEREVTHIERPELLEVAVGVETSSRKQIVWQVRLHDAGASNCGTPDDVLAGWPELIAPSGGRLTTDTFDMPPNPDPCELPPTSGYRGLENQTYRVEIHDPGPVGTATFKWSRENASVGTRVASLISATELELPTLGRDDVLRFNTDDWVEILDDERELSQAPGEIRKITVHEKTRRITFSSPLPAGMGAGPKSNLRVRRWDQQRKILSAEAGGTTAMFEDLDVAGGTGLIAVPPAGTTLLLERGLTVRFTSTGTKGFRTGDHWVFAARTADGSVESLVSAPPRGVHHHYERLAIWDAATGDLTDCRHLWSRGCCTFVVFPGEDIQAAIDRLPAAGGCVCLKVGVHEIRKPLSIRRSNVTLHGETAGAVVQNMLEDEALRIGDRKTPLVNVCVEEIRFLVARARSIGGGAIVINRLDGGAIRDCRIDSVPGGDAPVYTGIAVHDSRNVEIAGTDIRRALIGVMVANSDGLTIRENSIHSVPFENLSVGMVGIVLAGEGKPGTMPNLVERNVVTDFGTGIHVGTGCGPTRIAGNSVRRQRIRVADSFAPVLQTTVTIGGLNKTPRWWAIDVRVPGCAIVGNLIDLNTENTGGILFTAAETVVERNELRSGIREGRDLLPLGIVGLGLIRGATVEHCAVRGNLLEGLQGAITVAAELGSVVDGIEIVENRITARFAELQQLSTKVTDSLGNVFPLFAHLGARVFIQYGIRVERVHRAVVLRNQISATISGIMGDGLPDALIESNSITRCAFGMLLGGCNAHQVSTNVLSDLALWGILDLWGGDTTLAGNQMTRCSGYAMFIGGGIGHRIVGGQVRSAGLGLLVSAIGPRVDDLTITDARHGGIVGLLLPGEIGLSRNRLVACGGGPRDAMAIAILVLGAAGHVDIEGCAIRDTGGVGFSNPRFDVLVYFGQSARLHGCSISGQPMRPPHHLSHGIFALTRPWSAAPSFADVVDNDVAVSGNTIVDCLAFAGDVMGATNRVVNRSVGAPTMATVRLLGLVVSATGNRVTARGGVPSIRVFAVTAAAAVGNASSNGATITGALKPAPYTTFNVSA